MIEENLASINAYNAGQPVIVVSGTAFPIGLDTRKCNASASDIREGVLAGTSSGIVVGTRPDPSSSLVKVTEFVAASGAFSAVSSIEVSGFGTVTIYEDEEKEVDYSDWNGTYEVTSETSDDSLNSRILKHTTAEKYVFRYYEQDWDEYKWVFHTQKTASSLYDVIVYCNDLESGTWWDANENFSMALTIDKTITEYPAQELVLNVTEATGFTVVKDIRTWSFLESKAATSYETVPEVGAMYVMLSNGTLSAKVYDQDKQGANWLLFSANMTSDSAELGSFATSADVTYSDSGALLNSAYVTTSIAVEDFAGDFTFIADVTLPDTSRVGVLAALDDDYRIGIDTNGKTYNMWAGNSGWNILEADSGYSDDEYSGSGRGSIQVTPNVSQKIVFARTGDKWELYVDGVLSVRRYREGTIETGGYIAINRWGTGGYHSTGMVIKNVRMYKRGLTAEEIASLVQN